MSNHFKDAELPDKMFHRAFGVDLQFIDDKGNIGISVAGKKPKREVILEIRTWIGIGIGAQHHYAKLKFYDLAFKVLKITDVESLFPGTKEGDILNVSGYYDRHKPKEMLGYNIEITRKVTLRDKKLDGGETFKSYSIGDLTDRFDSRPEALAAAIKQFRRLFNQRAWKLRKDRY